MEKNVNKKSRNTLRNLNLNVRRKQIRLRKKVKLIAAWQEKRGIQ